MPAPLHANTLARREVVQTLYLCELTGSSISELAHGGTDGGLFVVPECPEGVSENDLVGSELAPYAVELLDGIVGRLGVIDGWIAEVAVNWSIERMPIVDRNIIRLAAFEIAYCDDVPTSVAIDEAVELAKVFGTDESPKFVNGVLGRIATVVAGDAEGGEEDEREQGELRRAAREAR